MQIIIVDLNNQNTLNLNEYIQVAQGESKWPITFVFKCGKDAFDMSNGQIGFFNGITANGNNVEFENIGNSSGQCLITLNSYAFQDAGNYQWLYLGVKDANENIIMSVPASLNVMPSSLNNGIDSGAYRDDWKNFKDGLTYDVNRVNSNVEKLSSEATSAETSVADLMNSVKSAAISLATDYTNQADSSVTYTVNNTNSATSYMTSATNSAVSYAESAATDAESATNSVNQAISNIGNEIKSQIQSESSGIIFLNDTQGSNNPPSFYIQKNSTNQPTISFMEKDSTLGGILKTVVCGKGNNCTDVIQTIYLNNSNIAYRMFQNAKSWSPWHGYLNDFVFNPTNPSFEFEWNSITDTSLLNGATGQIKAQCLGNLVIVNLNASNISPGDTVYQLPGFFLPASKQQAACVEANSNTEYVDFFGINTDGTIVVYQRRFDNTSISPINCDATFIFWEN